MPVARCSPFSVTYNDTGTSPDRATVAITSGSIPVACPITPRQAYDLPTKLNVPDTDPLAVVTNVKLPPKPPPNPASRPTRISNVPTALPGNALTTSVITRFSTTFPTNTSTFTKNVPD